MIFGLRPGFSDGGASADSHRQGWALKTQSILLDLGTQLVFFIRAFSGFAHDVLYMERTCSIHCSLAFISAFFNPASVAFAVTNSLQTFLLLEAAVPGPADTITSDAAKSEAKIVFIRFLHDTADLKPVNQSIDDAVMVFRSDNCGQDIKSPLIEVALNDAHPGRRGSFWPLQRDLVAFTLHSSFTENGFILSESFHEETLGQDSLVRIEKYQSGSWSVNS